MRFEMINGIIQCHLIYCVWPSEHCRPTIEKVIFSFIFFFLEWILFTKCETKIKHFENLLMVFSCRCYCFCGLVLRKLKVFYSDELILYWFAVCILNRESIESHKSCWRLYFVISSIQNTMKRIHEFIHKWWRMNKSQSNLNNT